MKLTSEIISHHWNYIASYIARELVGELNNPGFFREAFCIGKITIIHFVAYYMYTAYFTVSVVFCLKIDLL